MATAEFQKPRGKKRGRPAGSKNKNPGQRGRGVITPKTLASGEKRYVFRWTIEGKPFERTHRTEQEAEEHQEQWLKDRREKAYDRAQGIILGDFVENEWLPRQKARAEADEIVWTTYTAFKSHWESHLEPVFGNKWMHEVRPSQLEDFLRAKLVGHTAKGKLLPLGQPKSGKKTKAKHKLSKKTTKDLLLTMNGIYDDAWRRRLVTSNPCELVSPSILKGIKQKEVNAFSSIELNSLFYQLPRRFRLLMELCFYTAMRVSECRALRWEDVADGKIHLDKTVKIGQEKYDVVGRNKGKKDRYITIGAELQALLDAHREELAALGFKTGDTDLIFPSTVESFLTYNSLRSYAFLPADRTLRLQEGLTDTQWADLMTEIERVTAERKLTKHLEAYKLITRLLALPGAVLGRPMKNQELKNTEGILGAKWEGFDPAKKTLEMTNYNGDKLKLKLNRELVDLLEVQRERAALHSNRAHFIFIGLRGLALSSMKYSSAVLDKAMREVGLNTDRTIHVFRHTTATFLISEGKTIVEVQQLLGHARASTTADIYSHAWKDAQEQAPQDALGAYAEKHGRPGQLVTV